MALIKIGYQLADIGNMSREEMNSRLLAHYRLLNPRAGKGAWSSDTAVHRKGNKKYKKG